ncbi:MAG TPA: IS110 family transposase [Deltaproteobacteria bacterium]|nr:IS110 family transposase [Deltaproteobacteria bacterium]HDH98961.1 IS110 family transposase [Deltaproteobacteria bacterium]
MEAYAGIDLHSSNSYIGIIDEQDERHFGKRLPNSLTQILVALEPFKKDLEAVVVESTYNWYWLIDGLHEEGYKVHLANPSAIKQYDGLKHTDDKWDSFWLAHMKHLNILPEGYIYPKEERPVRDLLRRRLLFVRQRTAQILSLQSAIARNLSLKMSGRAIKKLTEEDAEGLFDSPYLVLTAKSHIGVIQFLTKTIKAIEDAVKSQAKLRKEFQLLKTISGIGDILSLTIMLEVGDINRFPKVGNYSSYCRCVKSEKLSNGKKKGENNRKNGNRYLSWAHVEAANFAIRFSPEAQKFYQRKMAKRNKIVAIKALSNKLARASYYVMRDQVAYDAGKLFG